MDQAKYIKLNPWQFKDNYQVSEGKLRRRFVFSKIKEAYLARLIVSLEGPRRIGKTTLVLQLIDQLLSSGTDPKSVHFYEFSDTDNDLAGFLEQVVPDSEAAPVFVFLDEVQYCPNWQSLVKTYYDHEKKLHLMLTGSSSLYLHQSRETLLGRLLQIQLGFLSFREYVFLTYQRKLPAYNFDHPEISLSLIDPLMQTEKNFKEYFHYGEIPALFGLKNKAIKDDFLEKSVLDIFFSKDLALYHLGKPQEMKRLYGALAQNCAQVVNKTRLAAEIGLSRPVIDKYLAVLVESRMIDLAGNYYRSMRKQALAHKKVFLRSINTLLNTLKISDYDQIYHPDFKGHVFENVVYNQLTAYFDQIFFWGRSQQEVDFLVPHGEKYLPIEVKATASKSQIKLNHLLSVMEKYQAPAGWVIYSGQSRHEKVRDKDIWFVKAAEL